MRYESYVEKPKTNIMRINVKEIEMLDKADGQLMYQKIKELRPKGNRGLQTIKGKQGNVLMEKDEVMERWAEYVEELYKDENRGVDDIIDMGQMENEVYIQSVAKRLKL